VTALKFGIRLGKPFVAHITNKNAELREVCFSLTARFATPVHVGA